MPSKQRPTSSSENKNISINGDVKDSAVIIGDNNTVNQTFFQKVINIFKSDSETLEQRNRRILLGHVENAWIKGVLDASLHGAALLDLGIKPDPEAVTQYPWAIKKESTDETLPAGLSMLEIFDSIGMGRSLLILGAPGSGKTTMLLELARQLIQHAREDVTYPIPMVFNLASWTEKLTLADWLAQELNNLYSVPRKTAPDWVKGNKLLLLLDGLDEVRQDSRAKCVEAINAFRKDHGLISLAVCSRSQDYADLNAKLSFEGAIEVQPLTQKQITEFFNRFGEEMAGIKQVLKKDSALREMAETPLFLSIMIMAYRDKKDVDILVSQDEKAQRKHLFDIYIERMFERPRSRNTTFKKQDILNWLSWLAQRVRDKDRGVFLLEQIRRNWLQTHAQVNLHKIISGISGFSIGIFYWLISLSSKQTIGLFFGALIGLIFGISFILGSNKLEEPTELLKWSWKRVLFLLETRIYQMFLIGTILISIVFCIWLTTASWWFSGVFGAILLLLYFLFLFGNETASIEIKSIPNQSIYQSIKNGLFFGLVFGLLFGIWGRLGFGESYGIAYILSGILIFGTIQGGYAGINHYSLRLVLSLSNLLPWRLVPFLNHCVDLIFLRRVGGGYIFVHRLLMEHFAEMYVDTPTSKGN